MQTKLKQLLEATFCGAMAVLPLSWSIQSAKADSELGNYQYWVRVPATSNTCEAEAASLLRRFENETRLNGSTATCRGTEKLAADGSQYGLYSLMITYQAPQELTPYSAQLGKGPISGTGTSEGAYSKYASCVADIPAQSALFEKKAALNVVAAYCVPVSGAETPQYALQMDAYGKPSQQLYFFDPSFLGVPDAATLAQVGLMITSNPSDPGTIALQSEGGFFYYAQTDTGLGHEQLGSFNSPAQCTTQMADAAALLKKGGAKRTLIKCLPIYGATALDVIHDIGDELTDDDGSHSATYYSFEECMGDKKRVMDNLTANGTPYLGGICQPDTAQQNQFELFLYQLL